MSQPTLYRAARLEVLADGLAEDLLARLPEDPFQPQRILVGSRMLEAWLRERLAERWSICARVEFLFPKDLLAEFARRAGQPVPEDDPWSAWALPWGVLGALPDLLADERFREVKAYLEEGGAGSAVPRDSAEAEAQRAVAAAEASASPARGLVDPRAQALAAQMAEVLDRCARRRPDLVRRWSCEREGPDSARRRREGEGDDPFAGVPPWLGPLWKALRGRLGTPSPVERFDAARDALENAVASPNPLWVFAPGALDLLSWEALAVLLAREEARLFLPVASDLAWSRAVRAAAEAPGWIARSASDPQAVAWRERDRAEGHPLRASLGRAQRTTAILLADLGVASRDGTDALSSAFAFGAGHPPASALEALQRSLAEDALPQAPLPLAPGDDSLALHACYGPRRQVEALRTALLHLFADHPHLEPRDVLVLCPDLETYAPLVNSIFAQGAWEADAEGRWAEDTPRLPVEVTDVSLRSLNPVAETLLRLLDLVDARLTVSEVFDFAALEPVSGRFDLDADDLSELEGWVRSSMVRWGRDAEHRVREELPRDPQGTWSWGLDRLLLGVARSAEGPLFERARREARTAEEAPDPIRDVLLPFDDAEGQTAFALGRFLDFWSTLCAARDALAAPRPLEAWAEDLAQWLPRLARAGGRRAWQQRAVLEETDRLARGARLAGGLGPVERRAVLAALRARFETGRLRPRPGAVTLAALRAGRAIPRKVVCLLGIDDGAFPRNPGLPSFDPTGNAPRCVDAALRDLDRSAFLDALLAAREHLLVFFTGRDQHTNAERVPAVPALELCEALDATFRPGNSGAAASQVLRHEHPLQPFDARCFRPSRPDPADGPPRPWSFRSDLLEGRQALDQRAEGATRFWEEGLQLSEEDPPEPVRLEDLLDYLKKPARHLLRRRLGLSLAREDDTQPPEEHLPLELDRLHEWQVQQEALEALRANQPFDANVLRQLASGEFPPGRWGARELHGVLQWVPELAQRLEEWFGLPGHWPAADPPLPVNLEVGSDRLQGSVGNRYGAFLVDLGVEEPATKHLLPLWVRLLCCAASQPELRWRAIRFGLRHDKKKGVLLAALGLDLGALDVDVRKARALECLAHLLELYRSGSRRPERYLRDCSRIYAWQL
ncbi:MAG: exonuclease V subunit gamma, partial [Planctomycetota bacterium]